MEIKSLKQQLQQQADLKDYLKKFNLRIVDLLIINELNQIDNNITLHVLNNLLNNCYHQSELSQSIKKLIRLNYCSKHRNKQDERTLTITVNDNQKANIKHVLTKAEHI
ncbi:MAG: hypothetical protein E6618_12470 [Staphylococcus warneri]|nr:hypothetical protein [Staphylococcus warneri]